MTGMHGARTAGPHDTGVPSAAAERGPARPDSHREPGRVRARLPQRRAASARPRPAPWTAARPRGSFRSSTLLGCGVVLPRGRAAVRLLQHAQLLVVRRAVALGAAGLAAVHDGALARPALGRRLAAAPLATRRRRGSRSRGRGPDGPGPAGPARAAAHAPTGARRTHRPAAPAAPPRCAGCRGPPCPPPGATPRRAAA